MLTDCKPVNTTLIKMLYDEDKCFKDTEGLVDTIFDVLGMLKSGKLDPTKLVEDLSNLVINAESI